VKGGFQDLTNEIARHFHSVNLCVPVNEEVVEGGEPYRENIEVISLPAFQGRRGLLWNLPQVIQTMRKVVKDSDVVYCMGPNDVGVLGMVISYLEGERMFASLDTDRADRLLQENYNLITKNIKYYSNKVLLYPLIRHLCQDVPVFVTGDMFMGEYRPWTQWVKTTLREEDMPPEKLSRNDKNKPFHVVFAGRLSPEKNLRRLIRAAEQLYMRGESIHCTIIGSGELRDELEQLAGSLELSVEFPGQIPNKRLIESRFLEADVLALPSLAERQGKVLLEAMACSVPVVASTVGGIPTVIEDGINGLLCDPHSVEDISQKLLRIIQESELRERLMRNGYEYAKSHALDVEVDWLMEHVARHYNLTLP
jgi:glycosyltransferase involved in cell wall biosynthesis